MGISKQTAPSDRYFDLKYLSQYSSLAIPTLRDYLRGGLPHYKLKGKILVKRSEFDDWMGQFRVDGKDLNRVVDGILKKLKAETV
jgi:hypothetical protein